MNIVNIQPKTQQNNYKLKTSSCHEYIIHIRNLHRNKYVNRTASYLYLNSKMAMSVT